MIFSGTLGQVIIWLPIAQRQIHLPLSTQQQFLCISFPAIEKNSVIRRPWDREKLLDADSVRHF